MGGGKAYGPDPKGDGAAGLRGGVFAAQVMSGVFTTAALHASADAYGWTCVWALQLNTAAHAACVPWCSLLQSLEEGLAERKKAIAGEQATL